MRTLPLVLSASALLLASCVNPYAKWYQGAPDARALPYYDASAAQEPLKIYTSNDLQQDRLTMMRRGYAQVGASSFQIASNAVSERQVRDQAAAIGAHAVLISSKYSHTVTGAMPFTVPTSSTSYTTGNATAYGSGGVVNMYGNATTTTYGSSTTMIPYAISRSDFAALYFVKAKARVGIFAVQLDEDAHRKLGTNAGVRVLAVVEGTPAFNADVFAGDVLLQIGDDKVNSPQHMTELFAKHEGTTVRFIFDRDGKRIEKDLPIERY